MINELGDATIAVTGAGGGIGSALVAGLAARGARVIAIDRRANPALDDSAARQELVDLSDEAAVAGLFADLATTERLTALIVAAGIQLHGQDGSVTEVPARVWQQTLEANLTTAFLTCKHGLPPMISNGGGSVVLIGSPTGLTMSGAGYAAYSASKAGMMGLSRVMATDYADRGIRCNVIIPGTIRTPLIESLLADPATEARLIADTPIGRLGEPADLVGLAAWLVSADSSFATGGLYPVDGGLTAR